MIASADQITATLVDQELSTSADTNTGGSSNCSNSGATSTSCSSTGPLGGAFGSASISGIGGIQLGAFADGFGGSDYVFGTGSATLSGTVSITGGTGTGYLLVDVSSSGTGPSYFSTANLNGQNGIPLNGWDAVPFTFGQNVDYSFSTRAQAGDDSSGASSLTISDIRVYGYYPTNCAGQSCTDLGYVDVTSLFAPNSVGASVSGSTRACSHY